MKDRSIGTEITDELRRDFVPRAELLRVVKEADVNLRASLRAAEELRQVRDHMEACRALLKVPDDEVLYQEIKQVQAKNSAMREAIEKLQCKNYTSCGWCDVCQAKAILAGVS